MESFLYYIRDNLVGTHYIIYAFIVYLLMFALIGYLFKQKYAKFNINLVKSQDDVKDQKVNIKKENVVVQNNNTVNQSKLPEINNQVNNQVNEVKKVETPASPAEVSSPTPMPNIGSQTINPTPMPNVEPPKVTPTPIPNIESKTVNSTLGSNEINDVKPNLSDAIPEIK